jgi:hypothetical protein
MQRGLSRSSNSSSAAAQMSSIARSAKSGLQVWAVSGSWRAGSKSSCMPQSVQEADLTPTPAAALNDPLRAFDEGVRVALKFQERHADTLGILTGDHETGGLSVTCARRDLKGPSSRNRFCSGSATT